MRSHGRSSCRIQAADGRGALSAATSSDCSLSTAPSPPSTPHRSAEGMAAPREHHLHHHQRVTFVDAPRGGSDSRGSADLLSDRLPPSPAAVPALGGGHTPPSRRSGVRREPAAGELPSDPDALRALLTEEQRRSREAVASVEQYGRQVREAILIAQEAERRHAEELAAERRLREEAVARLDTQHLSINQLSVEGDEYRGRWYALRHLAVSTGEKQHRRLLMRRYWAALRAWARGSAAARRAPLTAALLVPADTVMGAAAGGATLPGKVRCVAAAVSGQIQRHPLRSTLLAALLPFCLLALFLSSWMAAPAVATVAAVAVVRRMAAAARRAVRRRLRDLLLADDQHDGPRTAPGRGGAM
eukprot:TRINITY_DN71820_c0_g1_i1.p1 TRINITY_DN71820_c0_g1~~TRINITY_DN71820_c0_g1_i1.p1  ORF type:complete len:359 (+),score=93.35 TRINITY_DN71820_c0_g1_i1:68-1144(+)